MKKKCPKCDGIGRITLPYESPTIECSKCKGSGKVEQKRK